LGLVKESIGARKCLFESSKDSKEIKEFLKKNHLQGYVRAKNNFILRNKINNEIVALLSIRTPFHKKYAGDIEIARFALKQDLTIPGAFSKLLNEVKNYCKQNGYQNILSYADLAHGNGNVYEKNGFEKIGNTVLNYWYTDGETRYNRFKFRATKDKSERELTQENEVYRIYGCGNATYKMKITGK
jgi:hypothetical protein